jgi:hypothetical protein
MSFVLRWQHDDGSIVEFSTSGWKSDDAAKTRWLNQMSDLCSSAKPVSSGLMPSKGKPRLTKTTPERIEAILADIANGLTKEQACACNGVSATSFRKWEERPEFPDLRARAQGLRIKALLAKLEAAAESGNSTWKSWAWEVEKLYRTQFGDEIMFAQQNNFYLDEQKSRELSDKARRLLEDGREAT